MPPKYTVGNGLRPRRPARIASKVASLMRPVASSHPWRKHVAQSRLHALVGSM